MKLIYLFLALSLNSFSYAQVSTVAISGKLTDKANIAIPYANVVLRSITDSSIVAGTISDEAGLFILDNIKPAEYTFQVSTVDYKVHSQRLYVGDLSEFLDVSTIILESTAQEFESIEVVAKEATVSGRMDKKTYEVEDNISQSGGSVMQTMQNLPGITVQDGKLQLRGSENVIILIDGKQSGLTGFGNQSGLDNIPASSVERIEIINNPSAKFDANGSAGIINIILKKEKADGFNGKISLAGGLGALWIKRESLANTRPQYQFSPKFNPSLSLNYRKKNVNVFFNSDYLYTETLNKNDFATRTYDDGTRISQQTVRNRNTAFLTNKLGVDWSTSDNDLFTVFGQYGTEVIIDNGDEPFYDDQTGELLRLWSFQEDEVKTTIIGSALYTHKFKEVGHLLDIGVNYTFHREDEKYFFTNKMPTYTGYDAFELISDEQVIDVSMDYQKPLKRGKIETGLKFRQRGIPINMVFIPGTLSPLDTNAGGWADYKELIPAAYGIYTYQTKKFEAEIGLRVEYGKVDYLVNPDHSTYKSDGYSYAQPFPNARVAYRFNERNKISIFYNRRVNRPNEVDIRIFPKYDDAEIIKVGNPALRPEFTDAFEIGFKSSLKHGYFYSAAYHRINQGTMIRIASAVSGSPLIYDIFQNADRTTNTGIELIYSRDFKKWCTINLNANVYLNQIDSFVVSNLYPEPNTFTVAQQSNYSGNAKLNAVFHLKGNWDAQLSAVYLAPDVLPQGQIDQRFTCDLGVKKSIQKGKGSIFLNATDIFNTYSIRRTIQGEGFSYTSSNYYETQVVRLGYSYKF